MVTDKASRADTAQGPRVFICNFVQSENLGMQLALDIVFTLPSGSSVPDVLTGAAGKRKPGVRNTHKVWGIFLRLGFSCS